jgi:hypothetical protein
VKALKTDHDHEQNAPQETHDGLKAKPETVPYPMETEPLDALDDERRLAPDGRVLQARRRRQLLG